MAYVPDPRLAGFLRRLPKAELHLHIEGSLPWYLLHRREPHQFARPPLSWQHRYRFRSFAQFEEELLSMATSWFVSPARYHEAAKVMFRQLRDAHNVRYVETSFASGVVEFLGLDGEAIAHAIQSAAPEDMEVRVFMGIHHNGYNDRSRRFIDASVEWKSLAGIDLHGEETLPLEPWTARVWKRARDHGQYTKAHAGEFCGPDFVRRVIDELGVQRIEHGVRAAEDPSLLEEMARAGVACDVCPISNTKLAVVSGMKEHPLPRLLEAGVRCSINTDDTLSFGNSLTHEYTALHQDLGFGLKSLAELAANGFELALADAGFKKTQLASIEALITEYSNGKDD